MEEEDIKSNHHLIGSHPSINRVGSLACMSTYLGNRPFSLTLLSYTEQGKAKSAHGLDPTGTGGRKGKKITARHSHDGCPRAGLAPGQRYSTIPGAKNSRPRLVRKDAEAGWWPIPVIANAWVTGQLPERLLGSGVMPRALISEGVEEGESRKVVVREG